MHRSTGRAGAIDWVAKHHTKRPTRVLDLAVRLIEHGRTCWCVEEQFRMEPFAILAEAIQIAAKFESSRNDDGSTRDPVGTPGTTQTGQDPAA